MRARDAEDAAVAEGTTAPARMAGATVRSEGLPPELRCRVGMEGLMALHEPWLRLAARLDDPRFFHLPAWHLSYLLHLEADPETVRFFSFHRHGELLGVVPLRLAQRRVAGFPLRVWELPHEPYMDLCDVVLAPGEDGGQMLALLVDALRRDVRRPWDALHLPRLLRDSVALRALETAPLDPIVFSCTGKSMHFRCESLNSALSNASPTFARNLRRQRRRLDGRGRLEIAMVRDPDRLEAALDEFLRIEASGWKGRAGSAIRLHAHADGFYRDLAQRFGAEQRCSINLLRLDGKTIAAQYALMEGQRMSLLKIAYDEAYAPEAPGSRLLHEVLMRCCESPAINELSLVTGPAWASGRWNPEAHTVWSAYVFNDTPLAMAALIAKRLKRGARFARTLLRRAI